MLPVVGKHEHLEVLGSDREFAGRHAIDGMLSFVPHELAGNQVPIPRAHLTRRQCEAAPLLAFEQPRGRGLELRSALRDTLLELDIEPFELPALAIEIS